MVSKKGSIIGRIYQQTVIDTYSRVAFAKLYTSKHAITSADVLNDRVIPFFDQQGIPVLRMLTDRGTEFSGSLRTSTTARQRSVIPNQTGSVSGCIARCKMSFTQLPSTRSSIQTWSRCNQILMNGCSITIRSVLIVVGIVMKKRRCKLLRNRLTWQNKNC